MSLPSTKTSPARLRGSPRASLRCRSGIDVRPMCPSRTVRSPRHRCALASSHEWYARGATEFRCRLQNLLSTPAVRLLTGATGHPRSRIRDKVTHCRRPPRMVEFPPDGFTDILRRTARIDQRTTAAIVSWLALLEAAGGNTDGKLISSFSMALRMFTRSHQYAPLASATTPAASMGSTNLMWRRVRPAKYRRSHSCLR